MSASSLKAFLRSHLMRREGVVIFKMLLPFLFILAVVAWFHEFVWHAIHANIAINGLIICAASYGVILILIRLVNAQIDFYVIERFGQEAMQGVYMRQLLEEPWLKKRYVRHYLGHIALTGGTLSSAIEQNAIENELHALSGEYEHKMELPQFLVGFMIAMGLLGTFIGLLETLTGISGMLDGMGSSGSNMEEQFMKLVVELRKPLAGMGIAFSASMFGLVTSLMLAIMMINLRRYVSRVISCARNVMHTLTELTHSSNTTSGGATQLTPDQILAMATVDGTRKPQAAAISDGDLALQDLIYQAHDSSLLVANRIDGLTQNMEKLLRVMEAGLNATQKTNELLSFGPRMKETNEKILDELKNLSTGQIEQHKFAQRFVDISTDTARISGSLLEAERESQATMGMSLKSLSDQLSKIDEGTLSTVRHIAGVKEELNKLGGYSNENLLSELKMVSKSQIEQQKYNQRFVDLSAETARLTASLLEAQRESQAAMGRSLRDLSDHLVKIDEGTNIVGRYLGGIKEDFTKLGAYSEVAGTISTGVGHQTLLLETLVKEDRNLQKRLVSIQQDIRERLQQMDQDPTDMPPV